MRKLAIFLSCLLMSVGLAVQSFAGSGEKTIQVIVDNSGTVQNVEDAKRQERALFWHLTELRKKSKYEDVLINVVSTNNPRNLFVGTPRQLFKHGRELLPKLEVVKNGCSDILGAFHTVKQNILLSRAKEAEVYVFSSLIHAFPCENVVITLPQDVPAGLDISFLKEAKSKVTFFWVHNLQVRKWLSFLQQSGLEKFALLDEEGTKRILREGLHAE